MTACRRTDTFLYFCNMISRNKAKLIRSLETKKGREKVGLFVAEGPKLVGDLRHAGFDLRLLVNDDDVRDVSFLQHPQGVLGVFAIPDNNGDTGVPDASRLSLALDDVQDPGNLGTIIRIADWFGIEDVYCSPHTADCWSPKVVQATMGSIARVRVHYTPLATLLGSMPEGFPVYGTTLDGQDIYSSPLTAGGIVVMGNEGNGISPAAQSLLTTKLLIPNYPRERMTADSLNVAVATAIVCSEFRRRTYGTNI